MGLYSEEIYMSIRQNHIMQFGEDEGEKLYKLQRAYMELSDSDDCDMQMLRQANERYNNALKEVLYKKAVKESEDDTLSECKVTDGHNDNYGADAEFEKLKSIYCHAFGKKVGELLAKYMLRISQINNIEGLNDNNRAEHKELLEKYNQLINSLGGTEKLIEYSNKIPCYNFYGNGESDAYDEDKLKEIYGEAFGEENGEILVGYIKRISEIKDIEGLSVSNLDEYDELIERYNQLLDSLGGEEKLIASSYNHRDTDVNNYDDDDYDDDDDDEINTAGIDAIEEALEELYDEQEGFCYRTVVPYYLGGNDPIESIRVFESESGGIPHWHYITQGFTELYDKECDDEEISGYGFELTFRLKKNEDEPPQWVISLLQNIARYVFKTGNVFASGHYMNANGPIRLGYDTDITALAFITDSELPEQESKNGSFEFIQMVGITKDEMDAIMCWNGEKLMNVFSKVIPLCITDLDRKSLMSNEFVSAEFEKGIEKDGSSTASIYTDMLAVELKTENRSINYGSIIKDENIVYADYETNTIYIGAGHVENIIRMIRARLLNNREFTINSRDMSVAFVHCNKTSVVDESLGEDYIGVKVYLSDEAINEIKHKLKPKVGVYKLNCANIQFAVLKTEIKDTNGKIIEVIE